MKIKLSKPNIKNISQRKKLLAAGSILVLGSLIGAAVFVNQWQSKQNLVDCSALVKQATALPVDQDKEKFYNDLNPSQRDCAKTQDIKLARQPVPDNKDLEVVQYTAELAKAAYESGDIEQANIYADQVLATRENLAPGQLHSAPNENDLLILFSEMHDIKNGKQL